MPDLDILEHAIQKRAAIEAIHNTGIITGRLAESPNGGFTMDTYGTIDEVAETAITALRPKLEAKALRDYANRHHHTGDGHPPISTPSGWIDAASYCICGAEQDENGCTERGKLLADADTIERGETPKTTAQNLADTTG